MMRIVFMTKSVKINIGEKGRQRLSFSNIFVHYQTAIQKTTHTLLSVYKMKTIKLVGVDFFDDSKIQNLINAYLDQSSYCPI